MRAEIDGNRLRIYFNDGRVFFTFYDLGSIARDLADCELTEVEKIVYKQAFKDCRKQIPVPSHLQTDVNKKMLEIELDKAMTINIP